MTVTMMTDWLRDLDRLQRDGGTAVLVTVAGVRGSAPREVGASMLVMEAEASGTVGGGELEYQCLKIAARLLGVDADDAGFLRRFPLGPNCGQCCGGVVDVLFERVTTGTRWTRELLGHWRSREAVALVTELDAAGRPLRQLVTAAGTDAGQSGSAACVQARELLLARAPAARIDTPGRSQDFLLIEPCADGGFDIAIFGAGHVGSAVVHVMSGLNCNVRWIDSRRQIFPANPPGNVQLIESTDPAQEVAALPRQTFVLIMTHSHAIDLAICAAVLARRDFAYCGLIGSLSKRRRFEKRLRAQAFSDTELKRLTCPIGVSGIRAKQPAAIAIAVAADILRRRERLQSATGTARVHTLRQ